MSHTPHILASVFLCGLWLPIWLVIAVSFTPSYHCSQCGYHDAFKYLANPNLRKLEQEQATARAALYKPSAFTTWMNTEGNGWKVGLLIVGVLVVLSGVFGIAINLGDRAKNPNDTAQRRVIRDSSEYTPTPYKPTPYTPTSNTPIPYKADTPTSQQNNLISKPAKSLTSKTAVVISQNANLRSAASSFGDIVLEVPEGTTLDVIKQNGAWFYVNWGGQAGWIHGNTIKLID